MIGLSSRLPVSAKYLIVTIIGMMIDLSIGWLAASVLEVPIPLGVVAGFVMGASVNYVLHERWTFRVFKSEGAIRRRTFYVATLAVTLIARLTIATLIQWTFILRPSQALYAIIPSVGVSWCIGFILSKFVVFTRLSRPSAED